MYEKKYAATLTCSLLQHFFIPVRDDLTLSHSTVHCDSAVSNEGVPL